MQNSGGSGAEIMHLHASGFSPVSQCTGQLWSQEASTEDRDRLGFLGDQVQVLEVFHLPEVGDVLLDVPRDIL